MLIKQSWNDIRVSQNLYLFKTPQPPNSHKRLIDFDYGNRFSKTKVYGTEKGSQMTALIKKMRDYSLF